MGETPLTRLHATASVLFSAEALAGKDRDRIELEATQLFDPLYDLATRLRTEHETFVLSRAFLPVAAEVYLLNSIVEGSASNARQARLLRAERWLREFAKWFDRIGGTDLPLSDSTLLWTVFKKEFDKKAKSVFIAMSFRKSQTLTSVKKAINEALNMFNADHPNTKLAPRRVDEQKGSSYDIPAWVFNEIDQSGLVIADLTDERPNVYCEVGYAKSRGIPFILTFHQKVGEKAPWDRKRYGGNKVHFDLAAFRHIAYSDSLDLRDTLKQELDALFEESE
jgi:nucleoside 2-deoxyribosyltransferase